MILVYNWDIGDVDKMGNLTQKITQDRVSQEIVDFKKRCNQKAPLVEEVGENKSNRMLLYSTLRCPSPGVIVKKQEEIEKNKEYIKESNIFRTLLGCGVLATWATVLMNNFKSMNELKDGVSSILAFGFIGISVVGFIGGVIALISNKFYGENIYEKDENGNLIEKGGFWRIEGNEQGTGNIRVWHPYYKKKRF